MNSDGSHMDNPLSIELRKLEDTVRLFQQEVIAIKIFKHSFIHSIEQIRGSDRSFRGIIEDKENSLWN